MKETFTVGDMISGYAKILDSITNVAGVIEEVKEDKKGYIVTIDDIWDGKYTAEVLEEYGEIKKLEDNEKLEDANYKFIGYGREKYGARVREIWRNEDTSEYIIR